MNDSARVPFYKFKLPNFMTKTVITIIIAILAVIGISYGAYYFTVRESTPTKLPVEDSNSVADWKTYRNEELEFEVKYPENIFQLDKNTNTLSHTLKNFHEFSLDGSDLGLAKDMSIVFKGGGKECDRLEADPELSSIIGPFKSKYIEGVEYDAVFEGEGVVYYCVKNTNNQNIFLIERWFLSAYYSPDLSKQNDYIGSEKQEKIFNRILSTFKFFE